MVHRSSCADPHVFVSVALWGTGGWGGGERSSRGNRDARVKQKNREAFPFVFDQITTWFDFLDYNSLSFYLSSL